MIIGGGQLDTYCIETTLSIPAGLKKKYHQEANRHIELLIPYRLEKPCIPLGMHSDRKQGRWVIK